MTIIDEDSYTVQWNPDMDFTTPQTFSISVIEHNVLDDDITSLSRTFSLTVVKAYDTFLGGGDTKVVDLETADTVCL